ncbi:hypothetical protein ACS0TY_035838 [Phlomoides rotata]
MFVDEFLNDEELVFSVAHTDFKNYFVTRNDLMSFNPFEKIWSSIIDAWSIILNYSNDTNHSNRTFYFDLGHNLYISKIIVGDENVGEDEEKIDEKTESNEEKIVNCWKSWMSINFIDIKLMDMVFVPIHLNDHFFVAVVNFRKQHMQYLDNRKYNDPSA